ncbi:MAG TPA: 4Fe-4S dicluster domain-containing protein [Bacteroidales bacterium]|nr:4Fe-4S dicluster domain-containing protein [Bacteroidales bacterium]
MGKGFLFNSGRCVSCGACSAACILYNGWETRPRNIYVFNKQLRPDTPVMNMSLACNHCEKAPCMEGCPSGALTRDPLNGAIVLDEIKCLGCRYCQWNCPYDAPKFNSGKRIIEKCNLCNDSSDELPSCTTACPTGALKFIEIPERNYDNYPEWFPGKKISPAFNLAHDSSELLEIIPAEAFMQKETRSEIKSRESDWSLVMFSFISMIAVSLQASSFISGTFHGIFFFVLPVFAALFSLFHLGKPFRAWRAIFNPASSPVSREIIFFLLFSILSIIAAAMKSEVFSLSSSITGLILLIIIDSVYIKPDRRSFVHSGQTFISALLLIAYFTGNILPFTFIVILKVILSAGKLREKNLQALRFLRIAALLVTWAGLFSGFADASLPVTSIILATELLDRILFYIDFKPENIRLVTGKYINDLNYEKKRG